MCLLAHIEIFEFLGIHLIGPFGMKPLLFHLLDVDILRGEQFLVKIFWFHFEEVFFTDDLLDMVKLLEIFEFLRKELFQKTTQGVSAVFEKLSTFKIFLLLFDLFLQKTHESSQTRFHGCNAERVALDMVAIGKHEHLDRFIKFHIYNPL